MQSTPLTLEGCRNYIEQHLFEPAGSSKESIGEPGRIGVELEAIPYRINVQRGIETVIHNEGQDSLLKALIRASGDFSGIPRYLDQVNPNGQHLPLVAAIEFPDGSKFQFEPGGQVEIATAPCNDLETLSTQLNTRQQILNLLRAQQNIRFGQFGTNPWFGVQEIGLQVNKSRFRALASYFDRINPFGRQMMLQTCSLQVNLDLGNDISTRLKRIMASNLLAPFAVALFANSPITAGKVNGYKSYRSHIWQQLDNSRTGVLPIDHLSKTFNKDTFIDGYLDFALEAPIIYIEDFGDEIFPSNITLAHWLIHPINGLSPTVTHLKNHLSLLFPEVRLKGYLELRSADAPPRDWQMIPALFYTGLLYAHLQLDKTLDLLLPYASQLSRFREAAVHGMESDEIFAISKNLMNLAIEGLSNLPSSFKSENNTKQLCAFFEKFTIQRKSFADEQLKIFSTDKLLIFN